MARAGKSRKEEEIDETSSSPDIEPISAESSPTIEEIQARAYEIYLERGGADGNDMEDWIQAERELGQTDASQDIS
jgi:hypothetical protein